MSHLSRYGPGPDADENPERNRCINCDVIFDDVQFEHSGGECALCVARQKDD